MLSRLHLQKFKKGDTVSILTYPRRWDNADGFAGYEGIIEDIELKDKFRDGVGSIILKGETSTFIGTGIIGRLKLVKK